MDDFSSVIALVVGVDGLPTPPDGTIIIGPLPDGGMGYVDGEGNVSEFVNKKHNHNDVYFEREEVNSKFQQIESSINNSIQVVDDRVTNFTMAIDQQMIDLSSATTQSINTISTQTDQKIAVAKSDVESQISFVNNRVTSVTDGLSGRIDNKKDNFTENSAFNKDFGTTSGTIAPGDHTHIDNFTIQDMDGVMTMFVNDPVRGEISVETSIFTFSESFVSTYEWMKIGRVSDQDSGFVMPHDGVLVGHTAHCENGNNNSQNFDIYVDNALQTLFNFPSGSGNVESISSDKNIQFTKGQKLRIRAGGNGAVQDTVINLFVKWRP